MSDISVAQIIAQLATIDVNTEQCASHFLELEYPVADLLPDTIDSPSLMEPLHVTHRSEPSEARTSLGLATPTFFVELPAAETPTCYTQARNIPQKVAGLVNAINERAHADGSSTLQVVSFFDDLEDDLIFRFQLSTTSLATVLDFELASADMAALLNQAETLEWVTMLDNLVNRASDRAYYHVHDQLMEHFDHNILDRDEEKWADQWATSQTDTAQDMYLRKVSPRFIFGDDTKEAVELRLPCQHIKRIAFDTLKTLMVEECLTDRCPVCHKPVLTDKERTQYRVAQEVCEADASIQKHYDWTALDHSSKSEPRKVHTRSLSKVLTEALNSFEAPSMLCPPSMLLTTSEVVDNVLGRYNSTFANADYFMTLDPEQLVSLLLQHALDTPVGEEQIPLYQTRLQPGLIEGLVAWLFRTANFLAKRECRQAETGHLGLHFHGKICVYNPTLWEMGEEGEAPLEDDVDTAMDSLEAAMTEANFIGATPQTLGARLEAMDLDHDVETPEQNGDGGTVELEDDGIL